MNDKSVLIAEDDSPIRGLVCTVLIRRGFIVDQVGSGHDAIECIRHKHYDAIVLDLMMPDGSGDDVLLALATEIPNEKSVVIIWAASAACSAWLDSFREIGLGLKHASAEPELCLAPRSPVWQHAFAYTGASRCTRIGVVDGY